MNVKLKYTIDEPYNFNLIRARGIDNVQHFLYPQKYDLLDPMLLDNMDAAIELVEKLHDKRALIVVDSDCDGNCASAIFVNYMKLVYPDWHIDFVVHERKGHGLKDIVEKVNIDDYELVILPDAGSNDDEIFNEHESVHFLVLDHHLRSIETGIPQNVVIVNNQTSEKYSNKSLSGAGVTWQFCRAMDNVKGYNYSEMFYDLVAVAIIGDVMNITTLENRYIITKGLQSIHNHFLKLLIDNAAYQIGKLLTPMGVAFYVVPAINSMCRVGSIPEKERMFLAFIDPKRQVACHKRGVAAGTQVDVAIESVRECTNTKAKQKRIQVKMAELCEKQIIEGDLLNNKVLIIELDETFDDIPSEMNGLTATKLSNDYNRPTLIGRTNENKEFKGSIRGLTTIDMPPFKDFLKSSNFFTLLEGHQNAAGFEMNANDINALTKWCNNQLEDVDIDSKTWYVDFRFDGKTDTTAIINVINTMDDLKSCWGQGFPEALISIENLIVDRADITVMGKMADTVKISKNGIAYMMFKMPQEKINELLDHSTICIDIVGTANLNEYYGNITPQIFVNDYSFKDYSYGF